MRLITVCLFLLVGLNGFGHKFYVSIANLYFDESTGGINVSLKATHHDFHHILEMSFKEKIFEEQVTDTSKYGRFIQKYLSAKMRLFSDGKQADFEYLGFELTDRLNIYFYFTYNNIADPKNVEVQSEFMFEHFPKQENIVHYKYKDSTKSVTLVPSQPAGTIHFY